MTGKVGDIRAAALNLLARREHSRQELVDKLQRRVEDRAQLEALLEQLKQQGLQSDERFAASFVRARYQRGQGPARIRQELRQRGVAADAVALAFEQEGLDWFEAARHTRDKRFGLEVPADRKEHARQTRFLFYRGFDSDQVKEAMEARPEEAN